MQLYKDEEKELTRFCRESTGDSNACWSTGYFRTVTGYGNSPEKPLNGAAGQFMGRNVIAENVEDHLMFQYTDRELEGNPMKPNPLEISERLFVRDEAYFAKIVEEGEEMNRNGDEDIGNAIFSYWTQFMLDDWIRIENYGSLKPRSRNPFDECPPHAVKFGYRNGKPYGAHFDLPDQRMVERNIAFTQKWKK